MEVGICSECPGPCGSRSLVPQPGLQVAPTTFASRGIARSLTTDCIGEEPQVRHIAHRARVPFVGQIVYRSLVDTPKHLEDVMAQQ